MKMSKSKIVIGVLIVTTVIVAAFVIIGLSTGSIKCFLLDKAPTVNITPTLLVTKDDSCIAKFHGVVEYKAANNKSRYLSLDADKIKLIDKNNLEIQANCGKVIMAMNQSSSASPTSWVSSIDLEATSSDEQTKCQILPSNQTSTPQTFFNVPSTKHYKCTATKEYKCNGKDGKTLASLHISHLEFECNRIKEATKPNGTFITESRKFALNDISARYIEKVA